MKQSGKNLGGRSEVVPLTLSVLALISAQAGCGSCFLSRARDGSTLGKCNESTPGLFPATRVHSPGGNCL